MKNSKTSEKQIEIDARLVERLVSDQFPDWDDLRVEPVKISGHDNRTFHLGDEMSVRLPSAQAYAAHVRTEQVWLPKLAPQLPLPVPFPLAMGNPAYGYPWHWSVNKWIEGESATVELVDDLPQFARDLASFLNTLQSIDATGGPLPGKDNFFRGGDLMIYDTETRACIAELRDLVDVRAATAVWEAAIGARWSGPSVWLHGDVAADNLLIERGRLCAVIDFGQLSVGDPACDVTIAWTLLTGESREAFRSELSVDEATWARGRGWGLWKALLQLRRHRQSNLDESARAGRVIDHILSD